MEKQALIKYDYKSLLSDDGDDIVFYGLNAEGKYVIGSLMEEDDDDKLHYIHSVVYEVVLNSFKLGYISYLHLLKSVTEIYFVEKKYSSEPATIKQIKFEDIPKDCLPLENSFLPKLKK